MSLLNFFRDVRRWLAEGDFPAVKTTTVSTDHIAEQTGAHGVTVDNNVTAAGNITLANTKHLLCATGAGSDVGATGTRFGNIYGTTVASVTANHDHIGENTGGHGIVLDNAVNPGGDNTLTLGALATRWSTIYARYMGVYTVNAGATIDCWNYSSTALHQPAFASYRYYGTYASPTAIGSGAYLGALTLYGYDGSGSHVGANIFAYATEAWTHTPEAHGTSVYFQCTPTGGGSAVTIMIMSGTGLSLLNTYDLLSNTAGGSDIGTAANYFGAAYATTHYADHIGELTAAHTITFDNNVTMVNTKDILAATAGGSDLGATGTGWGDIYLDTTKKVQFRDAAISISSVDDGHLDIAADTSVDIAAVTKIGDGGTTNYAQFAANGLLTLAGTARVRKTIVISNANLGKGTTAPAQVILGNFTGWEFDINDDCVMTTGLPKDWASGTDITIEASWYIDEAYATNSGEVKWQAAWSMCPHDGSEAVDAPTHASSGDTGDLNIPATAKRLSENTLATIAAASIAVGDEIGLTIKRIALTAGTDPTAKPVLLHVYVRYIADKLGLAT